jgi:N-formylglutamate amidohydrolase
MWLPAKAATLVPRGALPDSTDVQFIIRQNGIKAGHFERLTPSALEYLCNFSETEERFLAPSVTLYLGASTMYLGRPILAFCAGIVLTAIEEASAPLVVFRRGDIPVIIVAAHGGSLPVPNCPPRTGKDLPKRARFVTARDVGTRELALAIAEATYRKLRQRPYLVILSAHRKYVDANRPPEFAFESESAQKVYEAFHRAVELACKEVEEKFSCGLLLDIHGQKLNPDVVYRGTAQGATVQRLRKLHGEEAFTGEKSLFGMLKAHGFKVYPDPLGEAEWPGYSGGYIVRRYEGERWEIDAYQLEFGMNYRTKDARPTTADKIADVIEHYVKLYFQAAQENK